MIDPRNAALLMIDMQNGFIDPASALCMAGTRATVPTCTQVLADAQRFGMAVFHVRRSYAADGSDIEAVRFAAWQAGGRPVSPGADDPATLEAPSALAPINGERVIIKPRFSAFFDTPLDSILRRLDVSTVVLIGTTSPNCIRTTCYDALSLGYNVAIVADATSSRTPEVQRANIEDMAFIGAQVINAATFHARGLADLRDIEAEVRQAVRG